MGKQERPQGEPNTLKDRLDMTPEELNDFARMLVKSLIDRANDPNARKKANEFHRNATRISPKDRNMEFTKY